MLNLVRNRAILQKTEKLKGFFCIIFLIDFFKFSLYNILVDI